MHVFPNGMINTLSNRTRDYSCHVFDLGVAYKEDVDNVSGIIRETGREMREDEELAPLILEDFEIFGLDAFADSAVVIKGRVKTIPGKPFVVGREFNRRIKMKFDEQGVEIPFPHRKLIMEPANVAPAAP